MTFVQKMNVKNVDEIDGRQRSEVDRTIYLYRDELVGKVKERITRLSNICQLEHLLDD
jgi:hypothetical protein